eukprot:CAMPEP_0183729246 /NCGR_PEP_ID=MMETSP0737-20130205/29977_1 /TAXON_ID=385413 /ORGANISM="Thalassiosira miniscula, Strain CCMP1093" /LENGTH=485 /DNA_ID=CAMNT_0025961393 /DNA_START=444 /DNA_END=1901 /DNA_ORIENTATION=-
MESALDFDLLAEYLLEDMGAGGFDFSAIPDSTTSPTIDAPTTVVPDPGVVTPHQSDTRTFVDPLSDGTAARLQQPDVGANVTPPLPANGDLAGELSQVQQMIATQQQQQQQQQAITDAAVVAQPQQPQPLAPAPAQPAAPPAPTLTAVRYTQQPQPAAPPAAAPVMAPAATIPQPRAPIAMAQPPANKRPRVSAAPSLAAAPPKKGPATYSFAASVASVNGANHAMAPQQLVRAGAGAGAGGPNNKSQAQIDRRRERNRILARRTRLRKKFFFESLQKDVADLQRENAALKSIVRSRLKPDDARVILERCNANERLPSAIHAKDVDGEGPVAAMAGAIGASGMSDPGVKKLDKEDFSLIQSIQNSQQCFIITDPSLHDNPIVYASDDFLTLTGYSQEEVLGRNCRFLQGTETCPDKVAMVRKAVQSGEDVSVTFVNYTSGGEPFWNSLFIAALRDADNNIVNFIGVIVRVSGPEPGDSEYGKRLK